MKPLPKFSIAINTYWLIWQLLFFVILINVSCAKSVPSFSASTTELVVCANSEENCSAIFTSDVKHILVYGKLEKNNPYPIAISINLTYDNTIVGYKTVKDVTNSFSTSIEPSYGNLFKKGNYRLRIMAGRNSVGEMAFEIQ